MLKRDKKTTAEMSTIKMISLMSLMVLCLFSCTNGENDELSRPSAGEPLTLFLGAPNYTETTRSLPDGFQTYADLYPQAEISLSTIKVFMAKSDETISGILTYRGDNAWTSEIPVDKSATYHIYGFMPSAAASGATLTGLHGTGVQDFSNGAQMTINNLDAVTPADICVIVGVEATNSSGTEGTPEVGDFSYEGRAEGNYAFLLLDHLYAGLHFRIKVNEEYNALRTIELKTLQLRANGIKPQVNVVVNLWSKAYASTLADYDPLQYDPIESATYTPTGTGDYKEATLYPIEGSDALTLTTAYKDFLGCFAPGSCKNFTLISTYDVKDRKGNLIRQNQTAENQIVFGDNLARGKINQYKITVNPTYLYVLSEPDLDSPTFDLTTE